MLHHAHTLNGHAQLAAQHSRGSRQGLYCRNSSSALSSPLVAPSSQAAGQHAFSSGSSSSSRLSSRSSTRCLAVQQRSADPYAAAGRRLESLINGVGDGEDELYYNMLMEEGPWQKLQVQAVLGGVCLTASTVICWLCDKDPAGGASLSLHSLQAAALGAAAAIPLVLYKMGSWLPETQADNAALSALRKAQTEQAKPWLYGMDDTQLFAHIALDTLPPLFLMLPAAQAGLTSTFAFTSAALGNATGVDLPEEFGFLLALLMTGLVTAAVRSSDFMTDPAQVRVVSDAVANADRYYRLMAAQNTSSSSSGGGGSSSSSSSSTDGGSSLPQEMSQDLEAARAALAFKAVAVCWREQESEVMRLCVTQQVLDFLYLGALWYVTGDMTAPCVAALLANAVDYHAMWTAIQTTSTGGPGGGSSSRGPRSSKHTHKKSSLRE